MIRSAAGWTWKLDLLGNWSGDGGAVASFVHYHPDGPRGYLDPVPAPLTYTEHHQTFYDNRITARKIDIDGDDPIYAIQTSSFSNVGGNLTDDGTHLYEYDAPALDSRLRQREPGARMGNDQ